MLVPILLIILILITTINTLLLIKISKTGNNTINKKEKIVKNNSFNKDEYLNSLKFNKQLDGLIVPLLGKYDNKTIVEKIIQHLKTKNLEINNIPKIELEDYIMNVLSNYSNDFYKNNLEEELEESTVEYYQDPAREFSSQLNNEMDLSNTLRNFYND